MGYLDSSIDNSRGKITLDRGTFKVLASETRIGILKKLDERQMTVTDLARVLEMNKATLFEHLEKLIDAGLIKKKEDDRKWVYYTLSWKGKNILHPERTKIAIVLSVSFICSIILIYLIISIAGSSIFNQSPQTKDNIAPTIDFLSGDDVTEMTVRPVDMIIALDDNKGIKESSLKIEYSISDTYVRDPDLLNDWQELSPFIEQGRVSVTISSINWSNNSGKYLYYRCYVEDKSGNSAQNVFVEYIEKIYENSTDLSINIADVSFNEDNDSTPLKGYREIPIEIKVHNTGSFDVSNVEISIFNENPDTNNNGIVDNSSTLITTQQINFIERGNYTTVELNVKLKLSQSRYLWVAIDPSNILNETNEHNNIINISAQSFFSRSIIPEFPPYIGVIVFILIVMICNISRKKQFKNER